MPSRPVGTWPYTRGQAFVFGHITIKWCAVLFRRLRAWPVRAAGVLFKSCGRACICEPKCSVRHILGCTSCLLCWFLDPRGSDRTHALSLRRSYAFASIEPTIDTYFEKIVSEKLFRKKLFRITVFEYFFN